MNAELWSDILADVTEAETHFRAAARIASDLPLTDVAARLLRSELEAFRAALQG